MGGQRASIALVIVGAAGMIIGGIVLASDDGDDEIGRTVTTQGAATSTTETEAATEATIEGAAVEEFYAAFGDALRAGDSAFLIDRLDPAVIERYGSEACAAYVERLADPEYSVAVLETTGPAPFEYETDGVTTTLDGFTVRIRQTPGGAPSETEAHVTIDDEGVRWLTDCGSPLESE